MNGEATQSSNYHHLKGKDNSPTGFDDPDEAHYAIDGIFGTDLFGLKDRCAITERDPGSWWQVDLKHHFKTEKVAVTTRKDRKSHNFRTFQSFC